jgi:hypothetical protein
MATTPLTGQCMCGAVRFEIAEPLLGALYCHYKRCQAAPWAPVSDDGLPRFPERMSWE